MNITDEGLRIYELLASDTDGNADDVELLCSSIFELVAEVKRLREALQAVRERLGRSDWIVSAELLRVLDAALDGSE